ncbi:MAG TPA: hypothetical protein VFM70_10665 [Salinimicrobium sp.]|nr:hypothetical protein [Salinimicrobium sp.]
MNRDFKNDFKQRTILGDVFIPQNLLRDKSVIPEAKIVFGVLLGLTEFGEKEYLLDKVKFSKENNFKKSRISAWIKSLEKSGYLFKKAMDVKPLLEEKNFKGMGVGSAVCEWCEVKTSVLHSHHYPIPKSKGGTATVDICPNCHHEFHFAQNIIMINKEKLYENERE